MYHHQEIEAKWQKRWEEAGIFHAKDQSDKPKFYALIEFPYPSGAGLHIGHPRSYTALDVIARKRRMEGFNVLYPIGWDAFGLPTENYAIKTERPPQEVTAENIATFTRQLKMLGLSFDWSREINTTDPAYYQWTQWMFLQFYKAGLAYKAKMAINWCPSCKIGLANEEVVGGCCERCGKEVEKREKEQWMIAITKYADRLLSDLEGVNYLSKIKKQQENWIGKSEGAEVTFSVDGREEKIPVFTTRPDTLFGATYLVLAPEHPLVSTVVTDAQRVEVMSYVEEAKRKSDVERGDGEKEKTGVFTGSYVINPVNQEKIPIWVADYVMMGYGTGAIMAVPAHDERDFAFAKKYRLPIREVVLSENAQEGVCWSGEGAAINSGFLDKLSTTQATKQMIEWLTQKGVGKAAVQYKLRDWVFSRQRYWGEPIPLVYCKHCAEEKLQYVFIHGFRGSVESDFFPWLKREVEKHGHTVVALNLPHTEEPKVDEQVQFLLDHVSFTSNTVIVAHSLGTVVAQKLLPKLSTRVRKTILVDGFMEPKFVDHPRTTVEQSVDWQFDADAVHAHTEAFVLLADETESVFSLEQHRRMAQFYKAPLQIVRPKEEHFCAVVEPAILELATITGWSAIPDTQLPLTLPPVDRYEPTDTGESPLASMEDWVATSCPCCGKPARRETDTMPNWAGSSWYFLRYIDPHNGQTFADQDKLKYWMPVDLYNGGMEHTTLHLLYSRFWNKFLFDQGFVPTSEPYLRRHSHGLLLAEDGHKMSKSKGNVVNPDEIVVEYGADALRMYILFMGPFEEPVPWSKNGLVGVRRFLEKVDRYTEDWKGHPQARQDLGKVVEPYLKRVSEDIEAFHFNTAISTLMELFNRLLQKDAQGSTSFVNEDQLQRILKVLCPFAPHLANELWERLGWKGFVEEQSWPKIDESLLVQEMIEMAVQVNGKVRASIRLAPNASEEEAKAMALAESNVQKHVEGKEIRKVIYVPGKILNVVTA